MGSRSKGDYRRITIKPYYQQDGITLFYGDCREVLPQVSADVVLTDPPWVLTSKAVRIGTGRLAELRHESHTLKKGAVGHFDLDVMRLLQQRATHDCLFLCGYKELGLVIGACEPLRGVFAWHKPNSVPAAFFPAKMDLSFIVWGGRSSHLYGRQHWPSMVFSYAFPSAGCLATERYLKPGSGQALHPCQGPLALYLELLRPFPAGLTILDCYAGTGTTLRAAKDLGLRAIGVELDESYCELIVRRLSQSVFSWEASGDGQPVEG